MVQLSSSEERIGAVCPSCGVLWSLLCLVRMIITGCSGFYFHHGVYKASWFLRSIPPDGDTASSWAAVADMIVSLVFLMLGYFGPCFNVFPGKCFRVAKSPVNSGVFHPPPSNSCRWVQLLLLRKTKANPASTTLVISIFGHRLWACAACMQFGPAFHPICCCHRLQRGTKFTFKSNLKQNEKGRKSWKRKLVTAMNMDLPAGPFTVAIKWEQEESAPACSCRGFDLGHELLSIRGRARSDCWLPAADSPACYWTLPWMALHLFLW